MFFFPSSVMYSVRQCLGGWQRMHRSALALALIAPLTSKNKNLAADVACVARGYSPIP